MSILTLYAISPFRDTGSVCISNSGTASPFLKPGCQFLLFALRSSVITHGVHADWKIYKLHVQIAEIAKKIAQDKA